VSLGIWHASTDGGIVGFVAKTDDYGMSSQAAKTETLLPDRGCEQPDGTVWVFGRDLQKENANDGFLLSIASVPFRNRPVAQLSFTRLGCSSHESSGWRRWSSGELPKCGKNIVSLY